MNFSDLQLNTNLKNSLNALEREGRMPHALIISGGNESVRKSLADHLAAWAVCNAEAERPCGDCKNCLNAFERSHSDIYYAKGSGKTRIYNAEELKNIVHDASIKPNQANRKVYVFEECDKKLPEISQNILLKTIEEPPQDILFIITCDNSKALLETIRSRAVTLNLGDEREIGEEARELAEDILRALFAPSEIELMRAAYKLSDRFTALEALDCIVLTLGEGLCMQSGSDLEITDELSRMLCGKLRKAQFFELVEITRSAQQKINQNVSLELVSTWLCSQYRKTIC